MDNLSEKRESAQISIKQHSNFRWRLPGGAQKLAYYVWQDSESIETNVCSQIGRKWNATFQSQVDICIYQTSFNLQFEDVGFATQNNHLLCTDGKMAFCLLIKN